ncbi:MAG: outer membrane beta-barrel protein [Nitrospira sp.]|nr:outer membrane beta-barrel protein [Nitrospira sp.]
MQGKRLSKYFLIWFLIMGVNAGWTPSVRAEFEVDFYGGLAKTENGQVEGQVRNVPFSGSPVTTSKDLKEDAKFKNALTVGGRVTYWTKTIPWLGVAFDGSYFKADAKNANIEIPVYGFSLLMMMRYPLFPNEQFPQGRLEPYFGVGPEFGFSKSTVEFENDGGKTKIKENMDGFGVDVRGGMLWRLHRHWGIFTEYRFTYLDINDKSIPRDYSRQNEEGTINFENLGAKLTTHYFLVGISFRF